MTYMPSQPFPAWGKGHFPQLQQPSAVIAVNQLKAPIFLKHNPPFWTLLALPRTSSTHLTRSSPPPLYLFLS